MVVLRIADLAEVMAEELSPDGPVPVKVIGSKAGEKLYEELMNDEETRRTVELDRYYVVVPAFKQLYTDVDYAYPGAKSPDDGIGVEVPYNSANEEAIGKEELRAYLAKHRLLEGE
jgi:FlaA1/EpsC-like NDP-sugar epimerase